MKTKLFLLACNLLQRIQKWIADHDKEYQFHRNHRFYVLPYAEFLQAQHDWKALEAKYGDWCAAYDAEPDECHRLESLLA